MLYAVSILFVQNATARKASTGAVPATASRPAAKSSSTAASQSAVDHAQPPTRASAKSQSAAPRAAAEASSVSQQQQQQQQQQGTAPQPRQQSGTPSTQRAARSPVPATPAGVAQSSAVKKKRKAKTRVAEIGDASEDPALSGSAAAASLVGGIGSSGVMDADDDGSRAPMLTSTNETEAELRMYVPKDLEAKGMCTAGYVCVCVCVCVRVCVRKDLKHMQKCALTL